MKDTEIEAKLAIRTPDPEEAMRALEALREVGGFRLRPLPTRRIRDAYLQLPDAHIHEGPHGPLALRRRTVSEENGDGDRDSDGNADGHGQGDAREPRSLLTLKGAPKPEPGSGDATGVTRRLEIEVPDDEAGWHRVERALRSAGIPVNGSIDDLMPLQVRETRRVRRSVEPLEDGDTAVAEVTLDTVELEILGHRVRFREVEVEALPGVTDPVRVVTRLQEALRETLDTGVLVPWRLSKLETGLELERLAAEGELADLVSGEGDLLPAGHDRIYGIQT